MKIYIVGGAVRDELLGFVPKDIDYLVTGATPEDMVARGFEQVGADFPVFLHPDTKDEYALARTERKNGVGYHGFDVSFDPTVTIQDDLYRRDLTINAMAKDPATGHIFDPHGGRQDLSNKVLRHVSQAFADDPLRVIRLARFAARYPDFTVARSTLDLATQMVESGELHSLPYERFWAEMQKVMGEKNPGQFFCVLSEVKAFACVPFFADLFGDAVDASEFFAMGEAVQGVQCPEGRLMFFTALMARAECKTIHTAPARTQRLYTNIWRARNTLKANDETIYTTLLSTRAWSQGPDFDDFVRGVEILAGMGEGLFITAARLRELAAATREVTAADFPEVQGRALGEAIALARRDRIWQS